MVDLELRVGVTGCPQGQIGSVAALIVSSPRVRADQLGCSSLGLGPLAQLP